MEGRGEVAVDIKGVKKESKESRVWPSGGISVGILEIRWSLVSWALRVA